MIGRHGAGWTLVEVPVAMALLGVVMGSAFLAFHGGHRGALVGMATGEVLAGAIELTQRLLTDLGQMVVHDPRARPLWIDPDGRGLRFLIPARDGLPSPLGGRRDAWPESPTIGPAPGGLRAWTVRAEPVVYAPVPRTAGLFSPARNGRVMRDVLLSTWRFSLTTWGLVSRPGDHGHSPPGTGHRDVEDLPVELATRTPASIGGRRGPGSSKETRGAYAQEETPTDGAGGGQRPKARRQPSHLLVKFQTVDRELRVADDRTMVIDLDTWRLRDLHGRHHKVPRGLFVVVRALEPGR